MNPILARKLAAKEIKKAISQAVLLTLILILALTLSGYIFDIDPAEPSVVYPPPVTNTPYPPPLQQPTPTASPKKTIRNMSMSQPGYMSPKNSSIPAAP